MYHILQPTVINHSRSSIIFYLVHELRASERELTVRKRKAGERQHEVDRAWPWEILLWCFPIKHKKTPEL